MKKKSSLPKIASIAILPAIILFITSTGCSTPHTQGPNDVWIQGMNFSPLTITVPVGTTVTWTNFDGMAQTATSVTSVFNSGSIAPNGTFSYQFTAKGTYPYVCSFHSSMKATVVVNWKRKRGNVRLQDFFKTTSRIVFSDCFSRRCRDRNDQYNPDTLVIVIARIRQMAETKQSHQTYGKASLKIGMRGEWLLYSFLFA